MMEGFNWFIGKVEDRDDPAQLGRLKIRAFGIHGNENEAPIDMLPWAHVLLPITSASLKHVGTAPVGIQVGSTVFGFFMDGNQTLLPVVIGVLPGEGDVTPLATGQQIINKDQQRLEPVSAYNAKYPFNKVFQSESGHVVELDDTPNFERIHVYHKAGTYTEIDQDGNRVNRIVGNDYEIVDRDQTVYIKGNVKVVVDGDYELSVTGNIKINGKTINLNSGTMGAARIGDAADSGDGGSEHADGSNKIEAGSSTVFIGD